MRGPRPRSIHRPLIGPSDFPGSAPVRAAHFFLAMGPAIEGKGRIDLDPVHSAGTNQTTAAHDHGNPWKWIDDVGKGDARPPNGVLNPRHAGLSVSPAVAAASRNRSIDRTSSGL